MPFKTHPYYDCSEADDWLDFIHTNEPTQLFQFLLEKEKELCAIALDRIKKQAGEDELLERPYASLNEFLYHPIGEHGFRVYIEYYFSQKPNEGRPDSDFWWVIFICPDARSPFRLGKNCNVIDAGWMVK